MGTAALIILAVVLCALAGLGVALGLYLLTGPNWEGE